MRRPYARGRLTIRDGKACAAVFCLRTGRTLVTDNIRVTEWQRLLEDLRCDVAAFDRVIFAGHDLQDWSDIVAWDSEADQ